MFLPKFSTFLGLKDNSPNLPNALVFPNPNTLLKAVTFDLLYKLVVI
jgi:hypothetical protein